MVKCNNCGLQLSGDYDMCPNCGSKLDNSSDTNVENTSINLTCEKCGSSVPEGVNFCPDCGNKIEIKPNVVLCEKCGSELPENILFCPNCGQKATQVRNASFKTCPNCGTKLDDDASFCDECGTNLETNKRTDDADSNPNQQSNFVNNESKDKINFNSILIPSLLALIVAVILSLIGLFLRLSWFSFILAIIISVGFFAGIIDNELNALTSGLIVGLCLGSLENTLVKAVFGTFASNLYKGLFGSSIIVLIIVGAVVGYLSNMFLKDTIMGILNKI